MKFCIIYSKREYDSVDDQAPLRRNSSRSSTSGNYQSPNNVGRHGGGERARVNILADSY